LQRRSHKNVMVALKQEISPGKAPSDLAVQKALMAFPGLELAVGCIVLGRQLK
jgi:hypothetical protein